MDQILTALSATGILISSIVLMFLFLIPIGNFMIFVLDIIIGERPYRPRTMTRRESLKYNKKAFEEACRKYGQDPEEERKKAREYIKTTWN